MANCVSIDKYQSLSGQFPAFYDSILAIIQASIWCLMKKGTYVLSNELIQQLNEHVCLTLCGLNGEVHCLNFGEVTGCFGTLSRFSSGSQDNSRIWLFSSA